MRRQIGSNKRLTLNEAMALPHVRARGTVRRIVDRHIGAFEVPGLPVRFSRWPARPELQADLLGEHNEAVLRGLLGFTDEEIKVLYEGGVIVQDSLLNKCRGSELPQVSEQCT